MQKRIAFDIDGVITENVYIPKEERTCERYLELKPNKEVVEFLDRLAEDKGWYKNDTAAWRDGIVWISSRNCEDPKQCFFDWCAKNALWRFDLAPKYFNVPKTQKAHLAQELGCAMLIDDSMEAIAECDNTVVKGMLFHNGRYKDLEVRNFCEKHLDQDWAAAYCIESKVKNYFRQAGIAFESTP